MNTTAKSPTPASNVGASRRLVDLLRLQRVPVGVKLLRSVAEYEAWPATEPTVATSYCGLVRQAMSGEVRKVNVSHLSCETAAHILGIEQVPAYDEHVESYASFGLYEDETIAGTALDTVPTLDGVYGFGLGPLDSFTFVDPDLVLMIASPYQAMRIAQGYGYLNGTGASASALGMHGMCAETTAATIESGEIRLSLLCSGARHIARIAEDELSVSMPHALLDDTVRGLTATLGRFEPDERKLEMVIDSSDASTAALAGSSLGMAYFLEDEASA